MQKDRDSLGHIIVHKDETCGIGEWNDTEGEQQEYSPNIVILIQKLDINLTKNPKA